MKIKILIPVATDMWNQEVKLLLEEVASPNVEIDVANIERGPVSIECEYDEAIAVPYILQELKNSEDEGFNAAVIYCFANPGIYAAKELLTIPVIGIGEAALAIAITIGERIGIIGSVEHGLNRNRRRALTLGVTKIVDIKSLEIPVTKLDNKKYVKETIFSVCKEMIEINKIDTIILGCGSILGISEEIEQKFSIPVIVPGKAGIIIAEGLAKMRVAQSKRAFLYPPKKMFII